MSTLTPASILSTLLLVLLSSSPLPVFSAGCNKDDKKALLAIKASFGNPYDLSSRNPNTACCDWYGVDCDSTTARVTGLSIFQSNISGQIPPSIADLPFLQNLLLHHLPNLTGPIPPQFSNLSNIQLLRITFTNVSGPVPSFLSNLTALYDLDLSFNQLTGSIPPTLANLPSLLALHLDRNRLTGSIPDSFGSFPKSSPPDLYLSHNFLTGSIPKSLGDVEFGIIDLSRNGLTGDASFLFGASKPTTQIDLSRNMLNFDLTDVVFPEKLTALDLNHNMINGSIAVQINKLTNLQLFNVSYNRLCGEIPSGAVIGRFDQYSFVHNRCLCGAPLAACN